jgi:uncharacterized protein YdbL (DUF1318 family)
MMAARLGRDRRAGVVSEHIEHHLPRLDVSTIATKSIDYISSQRASSYSNIHNRRNNEDPHP